MVAALSRTLSFTLHTFDWMTCDTANFQLNFGFMNLCAPTIYRCPSINTNQMLTISFILCTPNVCLFRIIIIIRESSFIAGVNTMKYWNCVRTVSISCTNTRAHINQQLNRVDGTIWIWIRLWCVRNSQIFSSKTERISNVPLTIAFIDTYIYMVPFRWA